jgi:hypothetical protein
MRLRSGHFLRTQNEKRGKGREATCKALDTFFFLCYVPARAGAGAS